ncbi:hypothetical protein C7R93_06920 [Brevibacillus fortis]|uniref:Uncharacterized protein n=1 Tax=Brevibacillus fortis TaxID=2126352 RepID=A0A2P7VEW7_9BACL|nr:hypothetical protein C7R93_06920 [Brevibacillus fortis]
MLFILPFLLKKIPAQQRTILCKVWLTSHLFSTLPKLTLYEITKKLPITIFSTGYHYHLTPPRLI